LRFSQLDHLHQQIRDLQKQLELARKASSDLPDTLQDDPSPVITAKARGQSLENVVLSGEEVAGLFETYGQ
jgi:hypothetical protein